MFLNSVCKDPLSKEDHVHSLCDMVSLLGRALPYKLPQWMWKTGAKFIKTSKKFIKTAVPQSYPLMLTQGAHHQKGPSPFHGVPQFGQESISKGDQDKSQREPES